MSTSALVPSAWVLSAKVATVSAIARIERCPRRWSMRTLPRRGAGDGPSSRRSGLPRQPMANPIDMAYIRDPLLTSLIRYQVRRMQGLDVLHKDHSPYVF